MSHAALGWPMTWAEDRALLRSTPSAVPGAETEARVPSLTDVARSSSLRGRRQSVKPSRHDAATCPAGRASPLANVDRLKFQFTLNQDRRK